MSAAFRIVIVGAGMTGLTLAALLAGSRVAQRLDISVIDAGPEPETDADADIALRVSALANGSVELLESLGAWQRISDGCVSPFEAMRVWDEHDDADSHTALRFDAAEFALPQLGFIVENHRVRRALLDGLQATDVRVEFGHKLERIPDADLVVAADGARSFVRSEAGIATRDWPYRQTAIVTHLVPEQPHGRVARQRFLADGPLGMLPLADGRISVVWSVASEDAERLQQASDASLGEWLTEASDHVLGALTPAGPRGAFALRARHAEHYVQQGLALIGDAAHAIHPLAGQGANLGLQDAAVLADVIESALESGEYPADKPILRRYERRRRGANMAMLHFMTGLNRLFATDSGVLKEVRSAGMHLFNRSGPIRERAVKVALGVS